MTQTKKKKFDPQKNSGPKVGEGFGDSRGCIQEETPIPKHNGLNINNEPDGMREREIEKGKRR